MDIRTRRIYDEPSRSDGKRILVDRLWPRGVSKDEAELDLWVRDLAPSDELREWFHDHEDDWDTFRERYFAELEEREDAVEDLLDEIGDGRATLLYASKRTERNNATALKEFLEDRHGE